MHFANILVFRAAIHAELRRCQLNYTHILKTYDHVRWLKTMGILLKRRKKNLPAWPSVTETRSEQNVRRISDSILVVTLVLFLTAKDALCFEFVVDVDNNQWLCARR